MLSNHYHTVLVGKNYLSMMAAIIKSKSGSVLLVDEPRVNLGKHWYQNIGETEKNLLQLIGQKHQLSPLINISQYLTQVGTIIYLNDKIIELGASPFANIRELMRKAPGLFGDKVVQSLSRVDPEQFNQECFQFFNQLAQQTYLQGKSIQECISQGREGGHLAQLFNNVMRENNYHHNLQLGQFHFVMQALFQTFFSNSGDWQESIYLLTSLLSPRYQVDEERLTTDLAYLLRTMGGHIKRSQIQHWEVYQKELKFILLSSFEGLVHLNQLYFFGTPVPSMPFEQKIQETRFGSIGIKVRLDHPLLPFYHQKRIIFSRLDHLGSDSPYWEVTIDQNGLLDGVYSYAEYQGSRPEFYFGDALRELHQSLLMLMPGLSFEDFKNGAVLTQGMDLWLESRVKHRPGPQGKLHSKESGFVVGQLEYWGPLRPKSMGLYSYILDLHSGDLA